MDKVIEFLFSLIPEWLKNRVSLSRLIVVLAPVCALYWIWSHTPEGAATILTACKDTESAVMGLGPGLFAFAVTFACAFIVMKYSDKKFQLINKEYYPESEFYESKENLPVQTKIFESFRDGRWRRNIEIENNLKQDIDYLQGEVVFSYYGTTTFTVPFEVKVPIGARGGGHKVIDGPITDKNYTWTSFFTYVEEIRADGKTDKGLKLDGNHLRKSRRYFVLNFLNYVDWLPFLGRYEITWLRKNWKFKLQRRLQYFPTGPRLYKWRMPRPNYRIEARVLKADAGRMVLRPHAPDLDTFLIFLTEATNINYYISPSWPERLRQSESVPKALRRRVWVRRKLKQLIWVLGVGSVNATVTLGIVSLILFVFKLALTWWSVVKYGILAAL